MWRNSPRLRFPLILITNSVRLLKEPEAQAKQRLRHAVLTSFALLAFFVRRETCC